MQMLPDGDRLVVSFRPFREPGAIPFMLLFFPFWTLGGIATIAHLIGDATWGDRPFLLFWLCGWAVAEGGFVVAFAWLFFGRQVLIATPEEFVVRDEIGRFARTRVYDATRIRTIEAARVPSDEEGRSRTDFCLELIHEGRRVQIGEGITELEAADAAAALRELVRPRRWWGEEVEEKWTFPELSPAAASRRSRAPLLFSAVFAVLAVTVAIGFLYGSGEDSEVARPRPVSADATYLMLASADAHAEMVSAGHLPLGLPRCDGNPVARHWVCFVRSTTPTGKVVVFRCEAVRGDARCARAPTGAPAPRQSDPARGAPTSTTAGGRSATRRTRSG